MSNLSTSLAQSLAGSRLANSIANRYIETLSENDLVYTRDCPATIFYNDSERNFAPNEKAYITYKGQRLYLLEGASEQLIGHDMDGSHSEWTSARIDFDANINPQKWSPSTDNDTHYNTYPVTFDGSSYYTWSTTVKAGEYSQIRLTLDGTYFTGTPVAEFDLSDGSVDTETDCVARVTPAGNGRYYISISALSDAAGSGTVGIYILSSGSDTFAGNGSDGIYFYGSKAEKLSYPSSYHRGGVNLLEYSQAFENAAWTESHSTADDNNVANPLDGETTACFLSEDTANDNHEIRGDFSADGSSKYCGSFYLKAGIRTFAQVRFTSAGFPAAAIANFNLSAGTASDGGGNSDYGIEDIGNGWYRCWVVTQNSNAATTGNFRCYINDSLGNNTYQGLGSTYGIYVFGAQVEIGLEPSTYEYTTDSANFGIRVATDAYWLEADVKDWVYTGKWKCYWIPEFDSATKELISGGMAYLFKNYSTNYLRLDSTDRIEMRDSVTGLCGQSDVLGTERGDIYEIILDYPNTEMTVIKNGSPVGTYSLTAWDWSSGSNLAMNYGPAIGPEGYLSKPIRA